MCFRNSLLIEYEYCCKKQNEKIGKKNIYGSHTDYQFFFVFSFKMYADMFSSTSILLKQSIKRNMPVIKIPFSRAPNDAFERFCLFIYFIHFYFFHFAFRSLFLFLFPFVMSCICNLLYRVWHK